MMRHRAFGLLAAVVVLVGMAAPAAAADRVAASGSFTTELFFPTFTTTPVGPQACRVTVEGELTFAGTLEGTGAATTTALIFAPCDEVATSPPGAFRDVFRSRIDFGGTVAGTPVTADILWVGTTEAGGAIDAVMVIRGDDLGGLLHVDAVVGAGGTYRGAVDLR